MMVKGKVKWYDRVKGFGFIQQENGEDIFVHRTGLSSFDIDLQPEEKVEFETKNSEKGLVAINVKPIN